MRSSRSTGSWWLLAAGDDNWREGNTRSVRAILFSKLRQRAIGNHCDLQNKS
ncbi:hypothetical protein [Microcoleus sp. S28C3]|uniref:hypothetical protein n=1 Tax=Microcoleus sp. S28C3 TaxID=3055414 RepID=UPI002FD32B8F